MEIVENEEELVKPCETITDIDGEGFAVIDILREVLSRYDGIGLAANQIGILKRACIISVPKTDEFGTIYLNHAFVNPIIKSKSDPILFRNEGCLSYPARIIETVRYLNIEVIDSLSPNGRKFTGLEAICAEHEIDHTNGITMFMRRPKSIGPNGECPCDSGKKFKKCCLSKIKTGAV